MPAVEEKVPTAHGWQTELPAGANFPASHGAGVFVPPAQEKPSTQAIPVRLGQRSGQKLPREAAQSEQTSASWESEYEPAKQGTQAFEMLPPEWNPPG